MTSTQEQRCGGCGKTGVSLFFIPGGWGWVDDIPGRYGMCLRCGESQRYREEFRAHFGEIKFVSDTDAAKGEASAQGA